MIKQLPIASMTKRLPQPDTWQEFEIICHQLWKDIWGDVNAQRNGRAGQKQNGVDVYGTPLYTSKLAAVQCKDKDALLGSPLTEHELLAEATKAMGFKPVINSFSLATTAARDQAIQEAVRDINIRKAYPFEVSVWSWSDIAEEIMARPLILNNYWRDFPLENEEVASIVSINSTSDKFHAFFGRKILIDSITDKTRAALRSIAYELCDNALLHGKARGVELSLVGRMFIIKDDGVAFNPILQLDKSKVTLSSHAGSLVVHQFLENYKEHINIEYNYVLDNGVNKNQLTIELDDFLCNGNVDDYLEISLGMS